MIKQKGELRRMNSEGKKQRQGILLIVLFMFVLAITGASSAAEKEGQWEGVDKVVVERIAKEHGREAREPLINTEQGDLMLFLFVSAGTVGGFIAGYSYRSLTECTATTKERTT